MTDNGKDHATAVAAAPAPSDETGQIGVAGLTKRFGDQIAVDHLDLTVQLGEFLVLLGPSGCGKTTTMRSVAGLETPEAGTITVGGRVVFDAARGVNIAPNHRKIGMVFQSYAIWPHRTVFENVAFPLKMQRLGRQEIRARVGEVLELVGLDGMGKRPASNLSGGQMQRVALARSVVMQPEVLLLDEPLSNLDAKLRERLRVELKHTQQELGTTAVYVTHDQSEALALADRVALMRDGVIEQIATPLELYRNPRTRFGAEFIGSNNVYDGTARVSATGSVVTVGGEAELVTTPSVRLSGPVSVCVRAEDIVLDPPASWDGNRLTGRIDVVNLLGSQVLYAIASGPVGFEVLAPLGAQLYRRGDAVTLGIPADAVRCFPEDERA